MPLDPVRIDEIGAASCGWNVSWSLGSCYRDHPPPWNEQHGDVGINIPKSTSRVVSSWFGGIVWKYGFLDISLHLGWSGPQIFCKSWNICLLWSWNPHKIQLFLIPKSRDVTRDEQHGFFGSRVICNFQIAGGHLSQNQGKSLNKNMFTRIFSLLYGWLLNIGGSPA